MTVLPGKGGKVTQATNFVAEIKGWKINLKSDTKETTPIGKREKDAEKTGYKNGKGYFIPQSQIWGSMREAAKMVKLRKSTITQIISYILIKVKTT